MKSRGRHTRRKTARLSRKTARASARPGAGSTNGAERQALPLLRSIRVLGLYRIEAVWSDGRKTEIDLAPHILRYAQCRPLRGNADALQRAKIRDGGVAIAWPNPDQPNPEPGDEIDISADAIAALDRAQTMTGPEFRDRLRRLGLSLDAAAATFAISRRQIAYYSAGAKPVPRHVVLALRGFEVELGGAR